jgi:hypothetical protein
MHSLPGLTFIAGSNNLVVPTQTLIITIGGSDAVETLVIYETCTIGNIGAVATCVASNSVNVFGDKTEELYTEIVTLAAFTAVTTPTSTSTHHGSSTLPTSDSASGLSSESGAPASVSDRPSAASATNTGAALPKFYLQCGLVALTVCSILLL